MIIYKLKCVQARKMASVYYYLPAMLYYTPGAVWQYVLVPVGRGVLGTVYNKFNSYMWPAETRDSAVGEEFIQNLRSGNARVYEVIGHSDNNNGVRTRFLILENSGRTSYSFEAAGSNDNLIENGPVHL